MAPQQDTSTGPERAAARAESTVEREVHKDTHGVGGKDGGHSREGNVNSGGQGLKGKVGDAISVGGGLRVGAGAYKEGAQPISPNPYYQSGTVETGGYGGPPNIGAVTPVFARARHDALVLAGQIVDDTTGNAAGVGKGVGEGLAPELVNMTPLTGQAARDAEKARVEAAAAYQTANPVMLHQLDQGVADAAQPADEFGNPVTDEDSRETGPVSGGGASPQSSQTSGSQASDADYDDRSERTAAKAPQSAQSGAETGGQGSSSGTASQSGPSQPRQKVDPTRSSQTDTSS